ncbi:MAG TPA: hypothetical protein PLA50_10045 [Bacteroidia bacterium]|nr:hypothetical protein [Bacteroidia bacterium]
MADYAHQIPEEEARSRSEILFPFIYLASKKMSSRSITRWLSEEKGVDFSAASVAKLLRQSSRYFQLIADRVQPLAEHISAQVGMDVETLLFTPYGTEIVERDLRANFPGEEAFDYTHRVLSELHDEWFSLDEEIRFRCKPYFDFEPESTQTHDE